MVIITGGASGIGLAIARRLLEANFEVICVDSNEEYCELAKKALEKLGSSFTIITGDILQRKVIEEVIGILSLKDNPMWVLINNASVRLKTNIVTETEDSWDMQLNVTLKAAFNWMQKFLEYSLVKKDAHGTIINISSVASQFATGESPSYHAGKAGLESLTRLFAVHAPRMGASITVCALRLGFVLKSGSKDTFESVQNIAYAQQVKEYLPTSNPELDLSVANIVLAIICSNNQLFNGAVLELDGGASKQDQWFLSRLISSRVQE